MADVLLVFNCELSIKLINSLTAPIQKVIHLIQCDFQFRLDSYYGLALLTFCAWRVVNEK